MSVAEKSTLVSHNQTSSQPIMALETMVTDRFATAMASVGESLFSARRLSGFSDEQLLHKLDKQIVQQANLSFKLGASKQQYSVKVSRAEMVPLEMAEKSLQPVKVEYLRCSEQLNPEDEDTHVSHGGS